MNIIEKILLSLVLGAFGVMTVAIISWAFSTIHVIAASIVTLLYFVLIYIFYTVFIMD
ncbi:putative membrane protein YqjE [Bacillus chungangensis]|uniref:Membrane protein YqjE n=1 Tax=Bacillus chungangensis TaxID=587633 RepID=A0ABT9WMS5_9BACI|nr:putative membrane protein YqjE [Bacillus chungangensis]